MAKSMDNIGFNSLEPLVHYRGSDYSPNNVKTLIISPDGVCVMYHCGKRPTMKRFNINDYIASYSNPQAKYKPMLSVLYAGHQITSIEEIIIVAIGTNGSACLCPDEANLGILIGPRSYYSLEGLKKAYKRLRYGTMVNNMNFITLLGYISKMDSSKDFISDYDFMSGASKTEVWGSNEYYLNNGLSIASSKAYPNMDGANGKLRNHFNKIKERKLAEVKQEEISKVVHERNQGLISTFEELMKKYDFYYTCYNRLNKIVRVCGYNSFSSLGYTFKPIKAELKECTGVNKNTVDLIPCNNEKEALEYNIEVIKATVPMFYEAVLVDFYSRVLDLATSRRETARILLRNMDCIVAGNIPRISTITKQIAEQTEVEFKGGSMTNSFVIACACTCKFFVYKKNDKFNSNYESKSTWLEVNNNGR